MGRDMKVLVIGRSGRGHALLWKLRQSPRVDQVFCAPNNALAMFFHLLVNVLLMHCNPIRN